MTTRIVLYFFGFLAMTVLLSNSCNSFDEKVLKDPRFASGQEYETNKVIQPKTIHFDNYTFVEGNDTASSTLGLFYGNKEVFLSRLLSEMVKLSSYK